MQFCQWATAGAGVNVSTRKHTRISPSATTVRTKQSALSEAERVACAGRTRVSAEPGLVIYGCGKFGLSTGGRRSRRSCVCRACGPLRSAKLCAWARLEGEKQHRSPPALVFLCRTLAPAAFRSRAFPLVAAQRDLISAT